MKKRPIRIGGWEFPIPSSRLFLLQVSIAVLDWGLAGCVLYFLLPSAENLSLTGFIGIYLLAQFAGLISQVPGGLGVFETTILLLLPPRLSASAVLGSLLAYRFIYYLVPLGIASLMLGAHEVIEKKEGVQRVFRLFGYWVPQLVPYVLSVTTFMGGILLLFSGATPAVDLALLWKPCGDWTAFFGERAATETRRCLCSHDHSPWHWNRSLSSQGI
jgi:phosphatidylglycerol lysyltransferase